MLNILVYPFADTLCILFTSSLTVSVTVSPSFSTVFCIVVSIFTGKYLVVVVPSPNCPYPLYPTANAVPSSIASSVCIVPADTSFTPYSIPSFASFLICCGIPVEFVYPNPNCPFPLYPTLHTLPSASNIAK